MRNGVSDRVEFVAGDAADLAPLRGPVDVVVSNILRTVNQLLLPTIHRALRPGGHAIFSGMEEPDARLFLVELAEAGFGVADQLVDDRWWAVLARRA